MSSSQIITSDPLLPAPFSSIPRYPLTLIPSPIQPLPRLSSHLSTSSGNKTTIYAKREDLTSGIAYGGNKTRKLEYLIPDAISQSCDTLISIGGVQSNHTRQVAGVAASLGMKCALVQAPWVPHTSGKYPLYSSTGNIQVSRLCGAATSLPSPSKEEDSADFDFVETDSLAVLAEKVRKEEGGRPYIIPAGASDHPLGGLGFARWVFELYSQEKEMGVFFDTVVVCAVTGSTMGGIIAGQKLFEKTYPQYPKRRILGIDASATPDITRAQVLKIAKFTAEKIGLESGDITEKDVEIDERWHAGVYGVPDEGTWRAMKMGAELDGLITDPVYEGKTLAGLIGIGEKEGFKRDGQEGDGNSVLFVHLGGQLALNAYAEKEE